jgi:hypothetical protein
MDLRRGPLKRREPARSLVQNFAVAWGVQAGMTPTRIAKRMAIAALVATWGVSSALAVRDMLHPPRSPYRRGVVPAGPTDGRTVAEELWFDREGPQALQVCDRWDGVRHLVRWVEVDGAILAWCETIEVPRRRLVFLLDGDPRQGAGRLGVRGQVALPITDNTSEDPAVAPWGLAYAARDGVVAVRTDLEVRQFALPPIAQGQPGGAYLTVATDRSGGLFLTWFEEPDQLAIQHVDRNLHALGPPSSLPAPDCGWEYIESSRQGNGLMVRPSYHCPNGLGELCDVYFLVDAQGRVKPGAPQWSLPAVTLALRLLVALVTAGLLRKPFATARKVRWLRRGVWVLSGEAMAVGVDRAIVTLPSGDVLSISIGRVQCVGFEGGAPVAGPCTIVGRFAPMRRGPAYREGPREVSGVSLVAGEKPQALARLEALLEEELLRVLFTASFACLALVAL